MELQIPCMDLAQIAASGQCFRMEAQKDGTYVVIAGEHYLRLRQEDTGQENGRKGAGEEGCRFTFFCTEEEFQGFWKGYFDLERDYAGIIRSIDPADGYLSRAAEFGRGIRILKQDLWEMLITFILSQQNNIPRIRRCVGLLCENYGIRKKSAGGEEYFSFPSAKALAGAEPEDLLACNLGYRAKYIQRTARMAAEGELDLQNLSSLPYEEAKKELMKLYGVGIKVAECVCLFALHHVEAFPIDTHISQVLKEHYPEGFPFHRYSGIAGILQQYIFYDELHGKSLGKGEGYAD